MSVPANEYRDRPEGGRMRRLGHFDGPVVPPTTNHEEPTEDQEEPEPEGTPLFAQASFVALILLFLGIVTAAVGVGLWAGLGPGLTTLGVGTFYVGFRIAQDND